MYVHVWTYALDYDVWICLVSLVVMMSLLRLHSLVKRVRLGITIDGLMNHGGGGYLIGPICFLSIAFNDRF